MAELVLMEKGPASMNVPAEKVQAYLADGWKEISRKAVPDEPVKPKVKDPAPVDAQAAERKAKADAKAAAKKAKADAGVELAEPK